MQQVTLKDGSVIDVEIREANDPDIENLMHLNQKWQKLVLGQDLKDGYVGAAFSKETFEHLIAQNQVIVSQQDETIIGYYLLNNFSKEGIIGTHEDIVNSLRANHKIDPGVSVCVGAQAVVDTAFMGSAIRYLMLMKLVEKMKGRYDYLFATIAKDNPRAFKAHTRDGWFIADENENLYFVLFKV